MFLSMFIWDTRCDTLVSIYNPHRAAVFSSCSVPNSVLWFTGVFRSCFPADLRHSSGANKRQLTIVFAFFSACVQGAVYQSKEALLHCWLPGRGQTRDSVRVYWASFQIDASPGFRQLLVKAHQHLSGSLHVLKGGKCLSQHAPGCWAQFYWAPLCMIWGIFHQSKCLFSSL